MTPELATWIQAIAAVVQAAVAIVLYRVTKQYVDLTRTLAETSSEQLRLATEERNAAARLALEEMRTRAHYLGNLVSSLPRSQDRGGHERLLREFPIWSPDEVRALVDMGLRAGGQYSVAATEVSENLSWMSAIVMQVKNTDPQLGYQWGHFNWPEWDRRWNRAVSALSTLSVYRYDEPTETR